ncbi:hypothetical protein V6N13_061074 [Hibiscus sabdariffa]
MLMLCERPRQGINNFVIHAYFLYFHILSDEMEALKNLFGSMMRSGFLCLRNGSIVVTIEFYSIQGYRFGRLERSLGSSGKGFNNLLEQDDKGDVSAETTGPAPAEVSAGIQISAERLLCYWLIPKSE